MMKICYVSILIFDNESVLIKIIGNKNNRLYHDMISKYFNNVCFCIWNNISDFNQAYPLFHLLVPYCVWIYT